MRVVEGASRPRAGEDGLQALRSEVEPDDPARSRVGAARVALEDQAPPGRSEIGIAIFGRTAGEREGDDAAGEEQGQVRAPEQCLAGPAALKEASEGDATGDRDGRLDVLDGVPGQLPATATIRADAEELEVPAVRRHGREDEPAPAGREGHRVDRTEGGAIEDRMARLFRVTGSDRLDEEVSPGFPAPLLGPDIGDAASVRRNGGRILEELRSWTAPAADGELA
ncbi:MAG TPA: hypothetical protein VN522_13660 [Solirubrobacterales bacterium]|nr:hypothetical protein [Solirubrobacterales bacterium]